ncbi:hypothetical protein TIFTF001_009086 [Ficus carica]|uniref:Cysteine-rich receptor-like protein kinase 25 n=1 Tax=Ficus carica TaxID=3494 RepID=A0AA88D3B9_FICCA|nr:hypothetical protein TIFTF001_009086 [Ficus carica]
MLSSTVFMTVHVFLHILMFLPLIFAAGNPLSYICSNETTSLLRAPTNPISRISSLIFPHKPASDKISTKFQSATSSAVKSTAATFVGAISRSRTEFAKIVWRPHRNKSFFNIVEGYPCVMIRNQANVTEPEYFRKVLQNILDEFAREAEHGAKSFLTKEVNFTGNLYIYGLMQCTPDLSGADCTDCLREVIGDLTVFAEGKQGGRVLKPSCNIWFYTFDKISAKPPVPIESPPPPPPPTPPPLSNNYVPGKSRAISRPTVAAIVIAVIVVSLALGCCLLQYRGRARNMKYAAPRQENETADSLQYDLITIETATNKFSEEYKLGKGGFGEVYKGILANGQEIAVKRLSKSSGQGEEEFRNEVALVAKLQHRNLARGGGSEFAKQRRRILHRKRPTVGAFWLATGRVGDGLGLTMAGGWAAFLFIG